MLNFPKWKVILIFIICACSVLFSIPTFVSKEHLGKFSFLPNKAVNLGLDLRGGSQLLLNVDFNNYVLEQTELLKDSIKRELRSHRVGFSGLKTSDKNIILILRDESELPNARKIIKDVSSSINISASGRELTLNHSDLYFKQMKERVMEQSIEIIRRRVDETGTKEPSIQRQGDDNILLQVPGLADPQQLRAILGKTAKLTFHFLASESIKNSGKVPIGTMVVTSDKHEGLNESKFLVYKNAVMSGDYLTGAKANISVKNGAVVEFNLSTQGAKRFGEITTNNVGKALAIVLDNKLISAPVINEPIIGGSGVINGNFTTQSANDLALLLRAGSLPAPINIVEERSVGPSLGSDSVEAGKISGMIGIASIMIFMILTYRTFGLFANIALAFNLLFIIAILAILEANLTLPGIAGIILTMGMAVDANVLIFERIREEGKNGLSPRAMVMQGFKNAFSTILDSNLTTIFAGILLFAFGSGTIKGFAVTLIVGITTSMFSAITLTKFMIYLWLKITKPKIILL